MDQQINLNCKRRRAPVCCMDLVVGILLIAFAFVLGVIVESVAGLVAILGLGALIVLAVMLAIMIIIRIIMIVLNCCRCC